MSVVAIRKLLQSWSQQDEDDLLFWWVVKYTEPDEAAEVLSVLPADVRGRFTLWLRDRRPGPAWIDRLGIFEGPEDINARLRGLHDALALRRA